MEYRIKLKPNAAKFYLTQPKNIQRLLSKHLRKIQQNPFLLSSLELDAELQIRKYTFKQYRIIYQVRKNELIVSVLTLGDKIAAADFFKELLKIIEKKKIALPLVDLRFDFV